MTIFSDFQGIHVPKSLKPDYNSFKDTSVCGHLDFNCLKLKYEVNQDILLFILAPILSHQGLRLSNLTLGLKALIFADWIHHKPKIVSINTINHKAVQKIDKHQASR